MAKLGETTVNEKEVIKLELIADVLARQGSVQLKAWGSSMIPAIWPGDLLTIVSAPESAIAPGEIVLVLRNQRFFIHRLITKEAGQPNAWITRGDALPGADPTVAAQDILGRVVRVRRGNRDHLPAPRLSAFLSAAGWLLGRSSRLRNLALGWHATRMRGCAFPSGQVPVEESTVAPAPARSFAGNQI